MREDQKTSQAALRAQEIAGIAFENGDVLHTCCDCCEHAALRAVALREAMNNAVRMIEGGYLGEAMLDLDRVLACLNDDLNQPRGLSAGEAPSAETVNSNSQAIASDDEGGV